MSIYLGNQLQSLAAVGNIGTRAIYQGTQLVFGNVARGTLQLDLNASVAQSYPGFGSIWSDLSGYNANFTLQGSYEYINNSIGFYGNNGSNASYTLSAAFNFGSGSFSTFTFVKMQRDGLQQIFSNNIVSVARGFNVGLDQKQNGLETGKCFGLDIIGNNGQRILKQTSGSLNGNQWYGLCTTYDGSGTVDGINIYVNGTSGSVPLRIQDSGSITDYTPSNASRPVLASRQENSTPNTTYQQTYSGSVGLMQIYDSVLTPEAVLSIYNQNSASFTL
jgi:hypothetical protein